MVQLDVDSRVLQWQMDVDILDQRNCVLIQCLYSIMSLLYFDAKQNQEVINFYLYSKNSRVVETSGFVGYYVNELVIVITSFME